MRRRRPAFAQRAKTTLFAGARSLACDEVMSAEIAVGHFS